MSNFICEYCGANIIDSDHGYVTGCEHYPMERPAWALSPADMLNVLNAAMRGESYLEWREGVLNEMAGEPFHYCDESFFQLLVRSILRCGEED